jgi:ATP-binding cassette subfamily B protein
MQGDIIAFVNYMTQTMLAFIVVINLVVIFTRASASADRINEVFDILPSVVEVKTDDVEPNEKSLKIEFKNVSFSYNNC